MSLSGFQPGETKRFRAVCKIGGSAENITADTVTFYLKRNVSDSDDDAVLVKDADVTTEGANGIALFHLTPTDTASVDPGPYYYEVKWVRANGDKYVYPDTPTRIQVYERVSDV